MALAKTLSQYWLRIQSSLFPWLEEELGDGLNTITDEAYVFQANTEKNDFANWIRDIIKDEGLAKDLLKVLSRAQAAQLVASRMAILSKRLA